MFLDHEVELHIQTYDAKRDGSPDSREERNAVKLFKNMKGSAILAEVPKSRNGLVHDREAWHRILDEIALEVQKKPSKIRWHERPGWKP